MTHEPDRDRRARLRPRAPDDTDHDRYPPIKKDDLPIDILAPRLRLRGWGPKWSAHCPAHADSQPSLSVTEKPSHKVLIHCHRGCAAEAIMAAIGLDLRYLYPSPYALHRAASGAKHFDYSGRVSYHRADKAGHDGRIDCKRFQEILDGAVQEGRPIQDLARDLGVAYEALTAIGAGFMADAERWVFPERTWGWQVVGLLYRHRNGRKVCEPGSQRGLTYPITLDFKRLEQQTLYLPEGPTDVAALLTVGAMAIGRPAAKLSQFVQDSLLRILGPHGDLDIVVLGDRDEPSDGEGVGLESAKNIAAFLRQELGRPVRCALPALGFKDVREQINAGKWEAGLTFLGDQHGG